MRSLVHACGSPLGPPRQARVEALEAERAALEEAGAKTRALVRAALAELRRLHAAEPSPAAAAALQQLAAAAGLSWGGPAAAAAAAPPSSASLGGGGGSSARHSSRG